MSVRESLIDYLQPLVTATPGLQDVRLITSVRATDALSVPLLIIKTDSYEKLAAAPTQVLGNFTLVLVSPHTDVAKAEEQLDELLGELLPSLFSWNVMWERATQTSYDDTHIAFDITIQSILS